MLKGVTGPANADLSTKPKILSQVADIQFMKVKRVFNKVTRELALNARISGLVGFWLNTTPDQCRASVSEDCKNLMALMKQSSLFSVKIK